LQEFQDLFDYIWREPWHMFYLIKTLFIFFR